MQKFVASCLNTEGLKQGKGKENNIDITKNNFLVKVVAPA